MVEKYVVMSSYEKRCLAGFIIFLNIFILFLHYLIRIFYSSNIFLRNSAGHVSMIISVDVLTSIRSLEFIIIMQ